MTDPKRIGDVMQADPDWRKLRGARKPRGRIPWPEAVVDRLPSGEDVVVAQTRGPARTHQCWQMLERYRAGALIQEIAAEFATDSATVESWLRQAMGARS